ncbi:hypothetical protein Y032_0034g2802 [Ancylostoma ceylanicum]|uniref:Uncharacterized protein n=1 Tax=Ancylostoma ceylanicum TaxID=53326 RepID=A0A016UMH1_9BILA|nr:hypothetical protein Y032_0034g2802 [Ancylostoma ceylanicum]
MSVDKSWGRGAGLSLPAARIQRGMQGRDAEENRAAVPTLVYGRLELTICTHDGLRYVLRTQTHLGMLVEKTRCEIKKDDLCINPKIGTRKQN